MRLKAFSDMMDEPLDLGPADAGIDDVLELGATLDRHGLIVYVENPPLQMWKGTQ